MRAALGVALDRGMAPEAGPVSGEHASEVAAVVAREPQLALAHAAEGLITALERGIDGPADVVDSAGERRMGDPPQNDPSRIARIPAWKPPLQETPPGGFSEGVDSDESTIGPLRLATMTAS